MTQKIYTLFRGVGGVDCGAEAAGLESVGGIEYDKAIAADCDRNFPHAPTTTTDIRDVDPALLPDDPPDVLHASPSCKNASVANQAKNEDGTKETEFDRECGRATCKFIDHWQPPIFTLENVWAYRNFDAFGYILDSLRSGGYSFDYWHLNFADYGVPQTRKRLILIAKRGDHRIAKPVATHHDLAGRDANQLPMFADMETPRPWVGWYEAIEDLIPTLPDSEFAPWQLARLPNEIQTMLVAQGGYADSIVVSGADKPAFAITANGNQTKIRGLIVSNAKTEYSDGVRPETSPAFTGNGESRGRVKAFLMGKNQDKFGDGLRWFIEPAQTIGANEHGSKAFVVDGKNSGNFGAGPTIVNGQLPIFTIQASQAKGMPRAYAAHRVVSLSIEALARLQSFPDDFLFAANKTMAAREIGNAVPPLGYQRIVESIIK